FVGRLVAVGGCAPVYPSTSNLTRRSMSFAENDAWKNSTPNCFTLCAGTVIMNPSASWGKLSPAGTQQSESTRRLNPCQHLPFSCGSANFGCLPVGGASRVTHKMWATGG